MSGEIAVEIKQYAWEIVDSNSWLIEENNNGLLIDAIDSSDLYDELVKLKRVTVILTHSHFDHIVGLNKIREYIPDVRVICTQKCSEKLGSIYRNMSATATAYLKFYKNGEKGDIEIDPFVCRSGDQTFSDKTAFSWYEHEVRLEAVFGHSDDSLIAIVDDKYLFSGDTLLPTPTVTRFPGGSKKLFLGHDVPKLELLEKSISQVFPGHGIPGQLSKMISNNLFAEAGTC